MRPQSSCGLKGGEINTSACVTPCGRQTTPPSAPLQRIEEGRFTKEAFIRDGPPKGYYRGGHKDEGSEDEDEYWGA